MWLDPHRMPYHPPRCRANATHSGVRPALILVLFILFGLLLLLTGCAQRYLDDDRNMATMPVGDLVRELAK